MTDARAQKAASIFAIALVAMLATSGADSIFQNMRANENSSTEWQTTGKFANGDMNSTFHEQRGTSYSKWDNGSFGWACAKGDLNGDGFEELIVSEPTNTTTGGTVWLMLGTSAGLQESTKKLIDYVSDIADVKEFGYSIAVGDFNGDSLDDVLVGEPGYANDNGRVFWFNGSASSAYINEICAGYFTGGNGDRYGAAIAAGDFNGDGIDDAVIGIPNYLAGRGRVEVRYGSASGISYTPAMTIDGASPGMMLGSSVVVGDFDGNGIDDFAIGIPHANSDAGQVRTFFGRIGTDPLENFTINGSANDMLGATLAAGDVNGDACDDLLIGMNTTLGTWKCYLYFAPFSPTYVTMQSGVAGDEYGSGLGIFDMDYDGLDEVLVGAPRADKVYIYAGSTMFSASNPTILQGGGTGERLFGRSIASGDFNHDGNVDVAIGEPMNNTGNGTIHVYHSPDATQAWPELPSLFRTFTQTLYATGRDVEDGNAITCKLELRSGAGAWTDAGVPQYDPANLRWFVTLTITPAFSIGNYSIRTRFIDSDGMLGAWLYNNDSFTVANIAPSFTTSGASPSSIFRGESATIFINGSDPDSSALTCAVRCRHVPSGTWSYLTMSNPGPLRWTAPFSAALGDAIGQYEFQARLSDSINDTGFIQMPFTVNVLNNVPVLDIPYSSSSFNNTVVLRNDTLTIRVRGNDLEDSIEQLSCTVRFRLNGTIPWTHIPATFETDRFEAHFTPSTTFALGSYDVRLNLTDKDYTPQNQSSYLNYPSEAYFYNAVTVANNLPTISEMPELSALEDEPISINLSDYEGDVEDGSSELTWTIEHFDNTAIASISSITGAQKTVTFTPLMRYNGLGIVNLTLTDSDGGAAHAQLALHWGWINHIPQITDLRRNSDSLQRLQTIVLTFNGTDLDANDTESALLPQLQYIVEGGSWSDFLAPITYDTGMSCWKAEYTIPSTMPLGAYLFRARFVDTHGANSSWSESVQIVVMNIPPTPPSSIAPKTTFGLHPTLSWVAGSDPEGESWTHISIASSAGTTLVGDVNVSGTSYTPSVNFVRGENYTITVWTVDADGASSVKVQSTLSIEFLPITIDDAGIQVSPQKPNVGDSVTIEVPIKNGGTIDCYTTVRLYLDESGTLTPLAARVVLINAGTTAPISFEWVFAKDGIAKLSITVENVTSADSTKVLQVTVMSKHVSIGEDPTAKYVPYVVGAAIGVVAFAVVAVFLRRKKGEDEPIDKTEPEVEEVQVQAAPPAPVSQPPESAAMPQYSQPNEQYPQFFSQQYSQSSQSYSPGLAVAAAPTSEEQASGEIAAQIEAQTERRLEVKETPPAAPISSEGGTVDSGSEEAPGAEEAKPTEGMPIEENAAPVMEAPPVEEDDPNVERKSIKAAAESLLAALWEADGVQDGKDEYVQMTMDRLATTPVEAEKKISVHALPSEAEEFATIPIPPELIDTGIDGVPEEHLGYIHEKVDVYMTQNVVEKIVAHCILYADRKLECMGFMLGDRFKWGEKEYAVVKDVVTTDLDTTAVSVRFKREGFAKLFAQLEKLDYDYIIVGWYHSHPGYSCFLSDTDIETQRRMFKNPHQAAVVCDPVRMELKAFKMVDEANYTEVSYAIIKDFQ